MVKYHKYISVAIGVLYLITLQEFSHPQPVFRFLIPSFFIFTALVTLYNAWYLKATQKYNVWMLVRPVLLLASAFGLLFAIPSSGLQGLFLLSAVLVIAFVEYFLGNFAENIILNETLVIGFGFFISITAGNMYFPGFHTYWLAAVFVATFLMCRSFYELVPHSERLKLISSFGIALLCSEFFWALAFLPFHFSSSGLILFNLFYFCIILNYYYIYKSLTDKKLQFHFMLMLICSIFIFLITPWKILI